MNQNQTNPYREIISELTGELLAYTILSSALIIIISLQFAFLFFIFSLFIDPFLSVVAATSIIAVAGIGTLFYKKKATVTTNHFWLFSSLFLGIELVYRFYSIIVTPEAMVWLQVEQNTIVMSVAFCLILFATILLLYQKINKLKV